MFKIEGDKVEKKEFVVLGLGRFGKSVATTLAESGCEVLVVDIDEDIINNIADKVTYAVKADATDAETLKTLGISNFDGAIIGMGENLESSVMATILVKELGIPYVLTKAHSELHARILKKVGADMVVFPEKETGIRIANNLMRDNFFDAIELSSTFSMMDIEALDVWIGKSLRDLKLRATLKINVIGIRKKENLNINPAADDAIEKGDVLVIIGNNDTLNKLANLKKQV